MDSKNNDFPPLKKIFLIFFNIQKYTFCGLNCIFLYINLALIKFLYIYLYNFVYFCI